MKAFIVPAGCLGSRSATAAFFFLFFVTRRLLGSSQMSLSLSPLALHLSLSGVDKYLDSEDSTKPIYLYVNCPGGSVIAGLAMYDTMQHIRSEVVTINVGLAASMASFILAAGAKVNGGEIPSARTVFCRSPCIMTLS